MSNINVNLGQPEVSVELTEQSLPVNNGEPELHVYLDGGIGPQGPPGPAGGSVVTYEAGENLSAGRVVVIDGLKAWYFQNTDAAHAGRAFGITTTSATAGSNVSIQIAGVLQDAAFGFTADRIVWVGEDGEIFDTQPVTGAIIQKAGVAVADKKLIIDLSLHILEN